MSCSVAGGDGIGSLLSVDVDVDQVTMPGSGHLRMRRGTTPPVAMVHQPGASRQKACPAGTLPSRALELRPQDVACLMCEHSARIDPVFEYV